MENSKNDYAWEMNGLVQTLYCHLYQFIVKLFWEDMIYDILLWKKNGMNYKEFRIVLSTEPV